MRANTYLHLFPLIFRLSDQYIFFVIVYKTAMCWCGRYFHASRTQFCSCWLYFHEHFRRFLPFPLFRKSSKAVDLARNAFFVCRTFLFWLLFQSFRLNSLHLKFFCCCVFSRCFDFSTFSASKEICGNLFLWWANKNEPSKISAMMTNRLHFKFFQ